MSWFWVIENQPTVCIARELLGRVSVAAAVGVSDMPYVTGDTKHMAYDL